VLEEIQVPVALQHRVVDGMQSFYAGVRELAALGEINADDQQPLAGAGGRLFLAKKRRC
jgi:hypothetical protein